MIECWNNIGTFFTAYFSDYENREQFFETEERPNGDISWKGRTVEKLSGSRLQIGEDEYDTSTDIQKNSIVETEDSVTKPNHTDEVKYRNSVDNLIYRNYKRRRFRFSKC